MVDLGSGVDIGQQAEELRRAAPTAQPYLLHGGAGRFGDRLIAVSWVKEDVKGSYVERDVAHEW